MKLLGANFHIWFPSALLIAGLINDLLYRKYHNSHFLVALSITLVLIISLFGLSGLLPAVTGALVATGIGVTLVLLKVIGAGDMKLMLVFGAATQYEVVLKVYLFAFVWASILGVTRAILSGEIKSITTNIRNLAVHRVAPDNKDLHMIPFTVPLFMGWLSILILDSAGVSL